MNDAHAQILMMFGGVGALWCLKELFLPKREQKEAVAKRKIFVADICHKWQPARKEATDKTAPSSAVLNVDVKQSKEDPPFENEAVQAFWVQNCLSLQEPFRGVIRDVLHEYDTMEPQAPWKYHFPTKAPSVSYQEFLALLPIPLWRHALNTATEFLVTVPTKERCGPYFCLGLIACLGHDIAKPPYDQRDYSPPRDAQQSADVVKQIINGRLHPENENDLLLAIQSRPIKRHKQTPGLTLLLLNAHARGRELELRQLITVDLESEVRGS